MESAFTGVSVEITANVLLSEYSSASVYCEADYKDFIIDNANNITARVA
jgi:hypothetical protein